MPGEVWLVQDGDLDVVYSVKVYLCLSTAEMCRCWKSERLSVAMFQVYTLTSLSSLLPVVKAQSVVACFPHSLGEGKCKMRRHEH